jgi:hypothetical protein
MSPDDYTKALQSARAEIAELLNRRANIDARLAQLKGTVDALSALIEPGPVDDAFLELQELFGMGISDAIRATLRDTKDPALSPTEIRDELKRRGVKLDNYANEMAVIHNTLARLERQGEIFKLTDREGVPYAYAMKVVGDRNDIVETGTRPEGFVPMNTHAQTFKQTPKAKTPGEQKRDLEAIRKRYEQK